MGKGPSNRSRLYCRVLFEGRGAVFGRRRRGGQLANEGSGNGERGRVERTLLLVSGSTSHIMERLS